MYKFLEIQYKLGKITKEQFEALMAKFTEAEYEEIAKAQEEETENDNNS